MARVKKDRSCFSGPTSLLFACPQCGKRRMVRPQGHVVLDEKRTVTAQDGSKLEHFIDICVFCVDKLQKRYYEPSKKELRKVLKALHTPTEDLGDKSLEEML